MDDDCHEYIQSNIFCFSYFNVVKDFVLTKLILYNIFGRGLVIITYYHRKISI